MNNNYLCFLNDWAWLIGTISVILLYLLNWYRRPNKLPPGPRGIPFLGYFPFMGKKSYETAYILSKKYGPIMSIRLGSEEHLFLNDFESIQKAFVKLGESLSGRRTFPPLAVVNPGEGLVNTDFGDKFKSQRRFGVSTLRGFGVGKKGMENICLEELQYLNEEIRSTGKAFDILPLLQNAISNNICSIVFGKRFEYNGDVQFQKMINHIINDFHDPMIALSTLVITFVPMFRYVPPFSYYNGKYVANTRETLAWLDEIAKEHEKTFDENNIRDFIDAYILERNKGKDSSFTHSQLLQYMNDLFVAGTETTATALYWTLLCFIHYPETQDKLREEVIKVLGSSGTASMSKKADMPYTNAFIQEIFRYRTLGPFGLPHKASNDTEIDGLVIPKDTEIHANIWAVHNDPNLWKDPEIFNPERFLNEEGEFLKSKHVIPFSVGPRHCLGEQLAQMEVFLFLVGMVQKFEFLPDPNSDQLPTIDDGFYGVVFSPKQYKIFAKEL